MKDGIKHIIGKTIQGLVVTRAHNGNRMHVYLAFTDCIIPSLKKTVFNPRLECAALAGLIARSAAPLSSELSDLLLKFPRIVQWNFEPCVSTIQRFALIGQI